MAAKNKPYEQFGPYILFKKLESDGLSELWRAARIDGNQLGPTVALRRLTGGNRELLVASASAATSIVPQLNGTSFAKNQVIDVINGVPFIAHEYAGGRSLRHIVDRARGGAGITPNPIPIDQAMVIAEKIALSLATIAEMKHNGVRLAHGALIPQFVWISDDGEIRVGGQQLGKGIVASLSDSKIGAELGRYFSPEYRSSGEPSKASEVFAMGGILFLLITGQEPPDATTSSAFANAILGAKTMTGERVPEDLRALFDKSLVLDPAARYASMAEMKQAISALAHGGKYSATTFNLAFYLSSLLKKEMEGETIDRDREAKVNLAPYIEVPRPAPVATAAAAVPMFGVGEEAPKSKAPLAIAVVVVLLVLGAGGYFLMGNKSKPAAAAATASVAPAPVKPKVVSEPIVASATPGGATSTGTAPAAVDTAAQQKAFENAVNEKLQSEMMKLQEQYTAQLKAQQAKNAPVPTAASAPAVAPTQRAAATTATQPRTVIPEDHPPSAAQLDQQRVDTRPAATSAAAPSPVVPQTTQAPAPVPAAAAASTVREGDVVEVGDLDTPPHSVSSIRPVYPPIAAKQRVEGTIIVSALISETGQVLDVKVLRGDNRLGLSDAAVRAVRSAKFSAPIKDGKRVKTWFPQMIVFKL